MSIRALAATCPNCGQDLRLEVDTDQFNLAPPAPAPIDPTTKLKDLAPKLRDKSLIPNGYFYVYRITSEQIKQFIIDKVREYVPDIRVEVIPRYTEKRRSGDKDRKKHGTGISSELRDAYVYFRVAFSDNIIEKNNDLGWFSRIGEAGDYVQVEKQTWTKLLQRWGFSEAMLKDLRSYKYSDAVEDKYGMTEQFIREIHEFKIPKRKVDVDKQCWVFFNVTLNAILADMFTDPATGKVPGYYRLEGIREISQNQVEIVVDMDPENTASRVNPHVWQILGGEKK